MIPNLMSWLSLSPARKRNINKILPFGFMTFFYGLLWSIIERGLIGNLDHYPTSGMPYDSNTTMAVTTIGSFFLGLIIGLNEVVLFDKLFQRRSFGLKILLKTIIYVLAFVIFLSSLNLIYASLVTQNSMLSKESINTALLFILSWSFWSVILYMFATFGAMLFYSEVSDNLGQGVLRNFLTGKYHKTRDEERIFMFLDMKSSTTIAEKVGNKSYHNLLKDFYADMTPAIINTAGEIYQYIGDEIIISWEIDKGLNNNNCIECFFKIKDLITHEKQRYIDNYGVAPAFKAGMHLGKVITGEIGVIKKDITFSGDVLNTTARIQGLCNNFDVDILISEDLYLGLHLNGRYLTKKIGSCELRGKKEKVNLITIQK
jgi:adenylate cyclase